MITPPSVDWRILPEPWSARAEAGSTVRISDRPILLTHDSVDRVTVRGSGLDMPVVASRRLEDKNWRAFELIGTGREAGGDEQIELELGRTRERITVHLSNGIRFDPAEDERAQESPGGRAHGFLGRHVDLVYEPFEQDARVIDGCVGWPLTKFLDSWKRFGEEDEARVALIVRIARTIATVVQGIGERPRKVLRRKRTMERVGSVRQVDPAGIRWLSRQPGRNLAERAGPQQRVLAVVREETHDTFENRVMRDLLERSAAECRAWLREHRTYTGRQRYRDVHRFDRMVRRLRNQGPLSMVRRASGAIEPNYVLQHDERYSRVWPWYVKLRRRQEEEDRLWRWSHRTFAEAVRLSIAWALDAIEQEADLPAGIGFERRLLLHSEQVHGNFVDPRSELAGWLWRTRRSLLGLTLLHGRQIEAFERRMRTGTDFAALVPDALVVVHDPFRTGTPLAMMPVWSRLRFSDDHPEADKAAKMADAINRARYGLTTHGLLVEPRSAGMSQGELSVRRVRPSTGGPKLRISTVRTPLRLDRARPQFVQALRRLLKDAAR